MAVKKTFLVCHGVVHCCPNNPVGNSGSDENCLFPSVVDQENSQGTRALNLFDLSFCLIMHIGSS